MSLIKLIALQRDGRTFAKDMLVDVNDITRPVIENISTNSIVWIQEGMPPHDSPNESNTEIQYIFSENLASLTALANEEMFTGTVVSIDGRVPVNSLSTFVISEIVGYIKADALGSKFLYKEGGNAHPIEYILSQTISQLKTLLTEGTYAELIDGVTITPDFSLSNNFEVVLGGNRTLGVPTNLAQGQSGVIDLYQDITGSRTLAYAWPYVFEGGVVPTLSTGALVRDKLTYDVSEARTGIVTITNATPAVVTDTAHGMKSGYRVRFTTTGGLPTGLLINTTYWITVIDADSYNLSTSLANAQTATFVATTSAGSGVHTVENYTVFLALIDSIS